MEYETFIAKARIAGDSLVVTIPQNLCKFVGIKDETLLKIMIQIVQEKAE